MKKPLEFGEQFYQRSRIYAWGAAGAVAQLENCQQGSALLQQHLYPGLPVDSTALDRAIAVLAELNFRVSRMEESVGEAVDVGLLNRTGFTWQHENVHCRALFDSSDMADLV